MVSTKPDTRATRLALLTAAALPVAWRKSVTLRWLGVATVTFGGGGGTSASRVPQAATVPAVSSAVTASGNFRLGDMFYPKRLAKLAILARICKGRETKQRQMGAARGG